jgi:hypothetical protein
MDGEDTGEQTTGGEWDVLNMLKDLDKEQCANPFMGAILKYMVNDVLPSDNNLTHWVKLEEEQCELFDGLLYHHAWPQQGSAGT